MGADSFGDAGGKLTGIEHHYDDSYESWLALMREWAPLSFAVAKPQAHAYVFCDFDNFHKLKEFMLAAGWYVFRTPLIVHKLNSGRVPLPDQGPRRQYEIILYAIKGDKPTTHIYPDVISTAADENLTHGAQKPVALYQNLLQRSVKPGDRVADFFAGSGTIFEAAHGMKCYAVGTEQSPEYYGMSLARIKRLKQLETPDIFEGL
jgi:DNA modification methylase